MCVPIIVKHSQCNVWTDFWQVELFLVRFPNSLGCELGERRAWERGIFLPWQIVTKIFIESGQLRTELACSTRELALSHWPTSHKCTECGCGAAFLPSPSLGLFFPQFGLFTQQYFPIGFLSYLFSWISVILVEIFVSHLLSSSQAACVSLPPVWGFPSSHLGLSFPIFETSLKMNLNYKNTMQTTVETGDIWLFSGPDKRFAEINTIRDVKYSTSCEHYLCWKAFSTLWSHSDKKNAVVEPQLEVKSHNHKPNLIHLSQSQEPCKNIFDEKGSIQ